MNKYTPDREYERGRLMYILYSIHIGGNVTKGERTTTFLYKLLSNARVTGQTRRYTCYTLSNIILPQEMEKRSL